MNKLLIQGVGGAELDQREMITVELIGTVEGLNANLGVKGKDEYYTEFAAFMNEFENLNLAIIDSNAISGGRFDDIDLSGKEVPFKEPDEKYFQFEETHAEDTDKLVNLALMLSIIDPTESVAEDGFHFGKGFFTPFGYF